MARTMKLLAFLGLLCCVSAQGSNNSSSVVMSSTTTSSSTTSTTSSAMPMPSTTSHPAVPTTTHSHTTPAPTSVPKPQPEPVLGNYTIKTNDDKEVCLRMSVKLDVTTTYTQTGSNTKKTVELPVADPQQSNDSFCNGNTASLIVGWNINGSANYLNFTFSKNASWWESTSIKFGFVLVDSVYPNFPNGTNGETLTVYTTSGLFKQDDSNRQFKRSYQCEIERNVALDGQHFSSNLQVTNLEVQAFEFKNSTSGDFDDPYVCSNSKGNKIVPIAVGAALAGLVIVVLIAYLIGRLKRRNQGSYEALS